MRENEPVRAAERLLLDHHEISRGGHLVPDREGFEEPQDYQ
jgi:hypothetical protein